MTEVATERGGDRFLTRLVSVTSPSGITVWFEGQNKAADPGLHQHDCSPWSASIAVTRVRSTQA